MPGQRGGGQSHQAPGSGFQTVLSQVSGLSVSLQEQQSRDTAYTVREPDCANRNRGPAAVFREQIRAALLGRNLLRDFVRGLPLQDKRCAIGSQAVLSA